MVDVVIFIFSSFWHWLGAVLMISAFGMGVGQVLRAPRITVRHEQDDE